MKQQDKQSQLQSIAFSANYCDQCCWSHELQHRKQMTNDTDKISELLKKTEGVLLRFEKERNDVANHLADIESEINIAADKLIVGVM